MKWHKLLLFSTLLLFSIKLVAQENLQIKVPNLSNWDELKEGEKAQLHFSIDGNFDGRCFDYAIIQGKLVGMEIDSMGIFTWTPSFDMANRVEQVRLYQLVLEAKAKEGDVVITKPIELKVYHQNRPPVVNELKPFYIKYNTTNTYIIDNSVVYDPDDDPIVIVPNVEQLPEGVSISSQGEISWSPSVTQFRRIKDDPQYITFYAIDQPSKAQTKGQLRVVATQMDLPPSIAIVPNITRLKVKENETINLRFYLSDPNGDDDIANFDYISNEATLPTKDLLIKNTPNQYEFTWQPGYNFVKDPKDSLKFYIDFFVLDKTQQREVKRIEIVVLNTINEAETDKKMYELYRGTLQRAWELTEQLKEKEEELKSSYNKAKKGKKNRSVVNASLGATTGLSSIFTKDRPDTQRLISTIGGTTVLTIGTLEATEVIGRSIKDLIDRLNYIIEKKNDIQAKGDIFARDFSLKSARRSPEFTRKMDEFMQTMNLKGLVALELDAGWEPKTKSTDAAIKKTFKDFAIEKFE